jgi:TetR/AcrR family transcriptional repressor of bet genes
MSQIARSAGVSPALAHHYFGGKEQLFLATMRHLLDDFGGGVREALRDSAHPRDRISGIIRQSFRPDQFEPATVSSWLAFYVLAQSDPNARRLLAVYARRLNSNLVDALSDIAPRADARRIAEGIAALIDGLYIRRALKGGPPDPASAIALVEDYVDTHLAALERRA